MPLGDRAELRRAAREGVLHVEDRVAVAMVRPGHRIVMRQRDEPRPEIDEGEDRLPPDSDRAGAARRWCCMIRSRASPCSPAHSGGRSADIGSHSRRTAPTRTGTPRPCRARAPPPIGCRADAGTPASRAPPPPAPRASARAGPARACHSSISAGQGRRTAAPSSSRRTTTCRRARHVAIAAPITPMIGSVDDREARCGTDAGRSAWPRGHCRASSAPVRAKPVRAGRGIAGTPERSPPTIASPAATASTKPQPAVLRVEPREQEQQCPRHDHHAQPYRRQRVAAQHAVGVGGEPGIAERAAAARGTTHRALIRGASARSHTQRSAMIAPAIAQIGQHLQPDRQRHRARQPDDQPAARALRIGTGPPRSGSASRAASRDDRSVRA